VRPRGSGPVLDRDQHPQSHSDASSGREEVHSARAGGRRSGREPKIAQPTFTEVIRLPAHSATMDDCCRIQEVLLGAAPTGPVPLTLGILEIVSTVELAVTAVCTASGGAGSGPSIDVQQVAARVLIV
jgi:hypothetical protein